MTTAPPPDPAPDPADAAAAKRAMRAAHATARAALRAQPERKHALDRALVAATLDCMEEFGAVGANIAAYNPLPSEPGPADFAQLLAPHARTLFLPISLPGGVLAWAQLGGATAAGALGVAEPGGARYTSAVLRSCGLVIAPALAVDTQGMRLGKGAGYYDRALAGLGVPVAAVVFDEEVVDAVPHDSHDQPVDAVITPAGFFRVGGTAGAVRASNAHGPFRTD